MTQTSLSHLQEKEILLLLGAEDIHQESEDFWGRFGDFWIKIYRMEVKRFDLMGFSYWICFRDERNFFFLSMASIIYETKPIHFLNVARERFSFMGYLPVIPDGTS